MDIKEAIKLVEEGKRLRRADWLEGQFIKKSSIYEGAGGPVVDQNGGEIKLDMDDFLAEDWVLAGLSFEEFKLAAKMGGFFKRHAWKNRCIKFESLCGSNCMFAGYDYDEKEGVGKEQNVEIRLDAEDIYSSDWVEVTDA